MTLTPAQRALWENQVQRDCLAEAGDDPAAGLAAAEYIIATQPVPEESAPPINGEPTPALSDVPLSAFFAFDIHDRRAQGVLNRALRAARGLSAAARHDLSEILREGLGAEVVTSGQKILDFVNKYRVQLAKVLTTTQLAAVLEGAREVAGKLPVLATFPGAVPPPPTLEPQEAAVLVDRLSKLTGEERVRAIYDLPTEHQVYAQQATAARDASPPAVPPTFKSPAVPAGAPEGIHLPTIDEAVEQLAAKNVLDRQQYDALDSAARAKAFTVAGAEAEETLVKIRDSLAENVREGADYEAWRKKVLADVDQGTFLSDAHQETVFRTSVQSAFSDGQAAVLAHPLVRSGFPYSAYDPIHDDRVREEHLALDHHGIAGTNIYRTDDPVFQLFRPPWSWNCRCSWTPMTVRQAAELGIEEAETWLREGVEPPTKAYVPMPPFAPPEGFRRAAAAAPLSVQLSMQPMVVLAHNVAQEKRDEGGRWTSSTLAPKIRLPMSKEKVAAARAARDKRANTQIPTSVELPDTLYLSVPAHVVSGVLTSGHSGETKGILGHEENRTDSVYMATNAEIVKHYVAMYTDAKVLRVNTTALDRDKFYYDAVEPPGDYDDGHPGYVAYRGKIPAHAIQLAEASLSTAKPEGEPDTALLYGAPEVGSISSATLDTAKERTTRVGRDAKKGTKSKHRGGRRRSLPRRLRVKRKWATDATLSHNAGHEEQTDAALGAQISPKKDSSEGKWITIGGHPEGGRKHVGGFRVMVGNDGRILKGRMRGKKVEEAGAALRAMSAKRKGGSGGRASGGTEGAGRGQPGDGARGAAVPRRPPEAGGGVAPAPGRPGATGTGQVGTGPSEPARAEVVEVTPIEATATIRRINKRLNHYEDFFRARGLDIPANLIDEARRQIKDLGPEAAMAAIGPEKEAGATSVQYEGATDDSELDPDEAKFLRGYLARTGVTMLQTGSTVSPDSPIISSFTPENLAALQRGERIRGAAGDFIPADSRFKDKLEEAQHLPGLESSEDIDRVVGEHVTALTPEVMAKFDEVYGKGKWIVKSYGVEAYAGFGIFFPEKAKEIRTAARLTIRTAVQAIRTHGYDVLKDVDGKITGLIKARRIDLTTGKPDRTETDRPFYLFGSADFDNLPNQIVRRYGKQIAMAMPARNGAALPGSPEDELRQGFFNVALRRNKKGVPIGITDSEGRDHDFGTPGFERIAALEGGSMGHAIHRAVEADEWRRNGYATEPKFMVQPAFEAAGVSAADRSVGSTWETAREGRVHVVTQNGKVTVIPYATLVGRGDYLPAVFASADTRAMERAVEEAISALPESERSGQIYAPDVLKDRDGKWHVLERNPSAEGGGSEWLASNPFVMDALVSHLTGREPAHVRFVRNLLRPKMGLSRPLLELGAAEPTATPDIGEVEPSASAVGGSGKAKTPAPALAHDVAQEKRDEGGRWTVGGAVRSVGRNVVGLFRAVTGKGGPGVRPSHAATKKAIQRLGRYKEYFRAKGNMQAAHWIGQFESIISSIGTKAALDALGEARAGGSIRVQYEGAFDELGDSPAESDFTRAVLDRVGITVLQTGSSVDPDQPIISTFSRKNLEALGRGERIRDATGDYIPTDQTFPNKKLDEAKHLPGLESSEDIDVVAGAHVTALTPEVMAKFDAKYGKGKWIVKSYGTEAYAGFGIFFPQKAEHIRDAARAVIAVDEEDLRALGYGLIRSEGGEITGLTNLKTKTPYPFGSADFNGLHSTVKEVGKRVMMAAPAENGARLPASPEDELRQGVYNTALYRDERGIPIGITAHDGKDYLFGTPEFDEIVDEEEDTDLRHAIQRAVEADEWRRDPVARSQGFDTQPHFMVQPAFEAVGVSDADRASGVTWETATEGRVHATTRGGKAKAIPYATLTGRNQYLPAVIPSADTVAMERAVEEAIDQLPESERTGQMYAPDVMKGKDGKWHVIELNPSAEGGGSHWMGGNPFVIDAIVSHVVGREPAHVTFIRNLLRANLGTSRPRKQRRTIKPKPREESSPTAWLSVDPEQPREPAGTPEGGRFAKKGRAGGSHTVKHGSLRATYTAHTDNRAAESRIPLRNYKQQDAHSCAFVAALTVARYLGSDVTAKDVLRTVRPTKSAGMDRKRLVSALQELGVRATYTDDLTVEKLRKHVADGVPVIVTVYPEDWVSDHWTVVQGFDEDRIYLTNYGSVPINQFKRDWFDRGEGLVCEPLGEFFMSVEDESARDAVPASPLKKDTTAVLSTEATARNLPEKIGVSHDWDTLRAVLVGRIENDVFAPEPWQPSVKGLPKAGGVRYADFAPAQWSRSIEQLDNLVVILEKEGVKVYRPPLVPLEEALSAPVGLTQVYVREAFSVVGDAIIVNQSRTPYRRKEARALLPFFQSLNPLRLPTAPDNVTDSPPDDPLPYVEGGDVYRLGGDVLITMSGLATSPVGFRFVADALAAKGVSTWPAYIAPDYEHGDYILMLVREGLCVAYRKGFVDGLLPSPISDWDCVEITAAEADPGMAANGIVLRENVLVMSEGNRRVVRALEKRGVDVVEVPFDAVQFFQGGVDCSTNELWRGD